ncbi:Aspartate aminotransferase [hydrothermal vent metagenome]|uniref:Aspartate aminotransferase n=1 Tax=hydrothermal vent metagenome TaxID=652676 RepID=A0A3B0Z2L3_9ZZZZ
MGIELSERVKLVKPSPTLAVTAKAAELRAAGQDIIGLGAGEPDFDTPDHIKEAAISAIHAGFTKYTAVDGTPELKQSVIAKFKQDNGFDYTPANILVSSGGKQSFYNLCQAMINPGHEVIIPAPYWVSYPDMVLLAGGKPICIEAHAEQQFKITAAQLEQAITDRTRLFVINSPSNPTGMAYRKTELKALADVLLKHPQVMIASDDMYEHIVWHEEAFCNILNAEPALKNRTIVLNGVSKAYSMTGWRIGYAAGPADLIKAMKKIQSQSTSNPASISQVAAEKALSGQQDCIATMLKEFHLRHDYLAERLNSIDHIDCLKGDGTFYCFPKIQGLIDKTPGIDNDVQFAEYLLEKAGVAVVPGSAFGLEGYMRLSFATSMENLVNAMDRIEKLVGKR